MISMKVSCSWRLFAWGNDGSRKVRVWGIIGDRAVSSMSGGLKSPEVYVFVSVYA